VVVADLSLDKEMLQDLIRRKLSSLLVPGSWSTIYAPAKAESEHVLSDVPGINNFACRSPTDTGAQGRRSNQLVVHELEINLLVEGFNTAGGAIGSTALGSDLW